MASGPKLENMATNSELNLTPSDALNRRAAVRKRGKVVAQKILTAARSVFIAEGYGALTMRRAAREAGLRLSNLQHYYKTRDDLFRAMMEQELVRYDREFQETMGHSEVTPEDRLALFVDFLLDDVRNRESAQFFFHLWSAAATNEYAARVMDEAYTHQCENAYHLIEPLTPHISRRVRQQRASILITMIDGIMLLLAPGKPRHSRLIGIDTEIRKAVENLIKAP